MVLKEFIVLYKRSKKYTKEEAIHDYQNVFKKIIRDLNRYGIKDFSNKYILDLGCGQRFPNVILFSSLGAEVYGLDINYISQELYPIRFFKTFLHDGPKRAFKTLIRQILFDKIYYRELAILSGNFDIGNIKLKLITANKKDNAYPIKDNFFDIIISNAVLEHVPDVKQFALEMNRMLKPGGIFHILYHNYFSLSGGHNFAWAYPDTSPPKNIPPWDHLRENRFPAFVYLNKMKPAEIKSIFKEYFELLLFEGRDINHDPGGYEGEQFYTEEVAKELCKYPKELLLTRAYCIIGKKTER